MMPYVQGDPDSIPTAYQSYREIVRDVFIRRGEIGFLTIDESVAKAGCPHRGARAKYGRALHTEGGIVRDESRGCDVVAWGGVRWGGRQFVRLEPDVEVLLANNIDGTCALWDADHFDTSDDGDIGYAAESYPYETATMMMAGDVHKIGVFTPHESLPVANETPRQFLRIVSSGVYGREPYFTENPVLVGYLCGILQNVVA